MIDPNQGGGGSTRRADGNLRTMLLPLPGQHHLCGQCLVTLLPARRAGRTIGPRRDEMQALRVGCRPRRRLTGDTTRPCGSTIRNVTGGIQRLAEPLRPLGVGRPSGHHDRFNESFP
jgi:hypothetical protein